MQKKTNTPEMQRKIKFYTAVLIGFQLTLQIAEFDEHGLFRRDGA